MIPGRFGSLVHASRSADDSAGLHKLPRACQNRRGSRHDWNAERCFSRRVLRVALLMGNRRRAAMVPTGQSWKCSAPVAG